MIDTIMLMVYHGLKCLVTTGDLDGRCPPDVVDAARMVCDYFERYLRRPR